MVRTNHKTRGTGGLDSKSPIAYPPLHARPDLSSPFRVTNDHPKIARPTIWGIALLAVPGIVLTPATAQENATSTLAAQHIARGDAYVDAKQLDQALEEYNEAIRLDPNQPTYYHRRGLLYKI